MKVLVACEYSGVVRDAFKAKGHYSISCDLLPTDQPGNHYTGDVNDILNQDWDLIVAHPPCTYLCNSGVRWLYNKDKTLNHKRWEQLAEAIKFFQLFQERAKNGKVKMAIENPIMHKYAKEKIGPQSQVIQPWQFGHGETKATCLWLYNLPQIVPTNIVDGREGKIHFMSPGPERWKLRSQTYQGIADAMANQWG